MKSFLATLKGKIIVSALSVFVVTAGIVAVVAFSGTEEYRSIKVNALTGQTIIIDEKNVEKEVYKGMNLKAGNLIEVKDDSNMTLLMDSDKYMFADEGTKFKVEASGDTSKANTKTRIVLEEGSVLCRLDSKLSEKETFEVETPNSVMSVRGTIFKMTIYKDKNGENYTRIDVLEGSVKVDLYSENGEKTGEEGIIEAGQAALVHSNTDISEFVIGESNINYDDFSGPMAEFVVNTMDNGREICIGSSQFKHYTGYETHPEEEIIVKEATATEDGLKNIYCPICDEIIRTETIPATGDVKEETTPVVEDKKEETTPVVEESTEETNEVPAPAHVHSFGEWSVVTSPTCESTGSDIRTCNGCTETETRTIAALGHSYGSWEVAIVATCEEAGEEVRECSNEGCESTETKEIAALGHSYGSWEVAIVATCEEVGEEVRECSNEGCESTETKEIAALGHSYGSWEVAIVATCEEAGEEVRECSNEGCESTETKEIAAIGHSYGAWEVTTVATCEEAGVETHTCTNSGCQRTETQAIAAIGHSYGSWEVATVATCEEVGEEVRECSNEGCESTETKEIAAIGHSYGAWEETIEVTCEEAGEETRTCTNSGCQKTETKEIEALGHDVSHLSTSMHLVEGDYSNKVVGDKVEIFEYLYCERCGDEVIERMTGTITQLNGEYTPSFTCDICGANG